MEASDRAPTRYRTRSSTAWARRAAGNLNLMPQEILDYILSYFDPKSDGSTLCALAYTSRRISSNAIRLLYSTCSLWSLEHDDNVSAAMLLRTLLRNPCLGDSVKNFRFYLGYEGDDMNMACFTSADWNIAVAAIQKLCGYDLWKATQLDCWYWPRNGPMRGSTESQWLIRHRRWNIMDENVDIDAKWLGEEWSSQLRAGRRDAVFALLLALVPGTEKLTLSGLGNCEDWIKYDKIMNKPTGHLIRILMRGAKNGQADAIQQPNASSPILPRLRSIALQQPEKTIEEMERDRYKYGSGGGRLDLWLLMPFLYLHLLESAEMSNCSKAYLHQAQIVERIGLKSLTIVPTTQVNGTGLSSLTSICHRLTRLHIQADFRAPLPSDMQTGILNTSLTLQYLSVTGPWSFCQSEHHSPDLVIGDLRPILHLRTLSLRIEHILGARLDNPKPSLASKLPASLESLTFSFVDCSTVSRILDELHNILSLQQTEAGTGLPALKTIENNGFVQVVPKDGKWFEPSPSLNIVAGVHNFRRHCREAGVMLVIDPKWRFFE